MKIIVKNNSRSSLRKVDAMKQFLMFCQENSPLNREIEITFVDSTNDTVFESRYFIPLRNVRTMDCYRFIANKWICEFAKQRKINCGEGEKKLLVDFFIKKNPQLTNII